MTLARINLEARETSTSLTLELNSSRRSGPLPRSLKMRLVIKSMTGVDMPSPMAPTRPSTMSTTSAASACMNTDANDRITGAEFLALAAAGGGPSSLPMSAGEVVVAATPPHSPRRVSLVTLPLLRVL